MQSAADIAREMDEGLAALFRAGLELSLQVQADAMAAETPRERAELALAFHRLSRSVRQTAALRIKAVADRERAVREALAHDAARAAAADQERRRRRKVQVTQAVLAWAEREKPDFDLEDLETRLDAVLETEALYDDFLTDDLDGQVALLAAAFGIAVPAGRPSSEGLSSEAPDPPAASGHDGFDAAPPYPPSG